MTVRIGFVINPIAGMGGRVGLKGTDGVYDEAVNRGAQPIAHQRAVLCLQEFISCVDESIDLEWYTVSGEMGQNVLEEVSLSDFAIVYTPKEEHTLSSDTKEVCQQFLDKSCDLILFCGGDGTARDIVSIVQDTIPILGIPSGVKMHSAVFGITPQAAGKMLFEFIHGRLRSGDAEIMDLDEQLYRKGTWNVRLYATAKGLIEPSYIQMGKQVFSEVSEENVKDELAEHIKDEMDGHPDTLYVIGSGGTLEYIAKKIGFENTLLGIDVVYQEKTVKKDVNERQLLDILKSYAKIKVLLSPIGAQGFIIGRGNLQLSPKVLKTVGIENIMVLATPAKILSTPILRVDSGDKEIDNLFTKQEMMMVLIGYRLFRVVHIQPSE